MNVIITGASKGIGKAIAECFAAAGANLFLCARNEVSLYNTVAELQVKYSDSSINAKIADMSKKEAVQAFGKWVLDRVDAIDVLINNAGQFLPGHVTVPKTRPAPGTFIMPTALN